MMRLTDLVREKGPRWGAVQPVELFEQLDLRSGDVQELWRPQADALREWDEHWRDANDVLLKLNTGAGKTLVGLLAAQSLVNETRGRVLYLCATNQLLEQTANKAHEYGIEVATYYSGSWTHEEIYTRSAGPLLTNYHAAFNGRSRFARPEFAPVACIFDDAHTAHHTVRDQFTLRVTREKNPELYDQLTDCFSPHFFNNNRGIVFRDVVEQRDPDTVLFVPLFVSAPLVDTIQALLSDDDSFLDRPPALFVWPHLRDHLHHCAILLDHGRIDFTPLVPPVHTLKIFGPDVRRLYLSATLRVSESFCRTYGRYPQHSIEPGGRAGDTERMMLTAPRDLAESATIDWAKSLIDGRKALVMTPSKRMAQSWEEVGDVFFSSAGHRRIEEFASSADQKLVLAARYDGIDLPGEACRILVVDGLPHGVSLLERFLESHLDLRGISSEIIATRIVQLLGRISRGMTDYGVFLLVGRRLLRWLDSPENRALLPKHIRGQLTLSDMLADSYSEASPEDLVSRCLGRDSDWLLAYTGHMAAAPELDHGGGAVTDPPRLAGAEVEYVQRLWDGQRDKAAKKLFAVRDAARQQEVALAAWHLHWVAHALAEIDSDAATENYRDAGRMCIELGRLPRDFEPIRAEATLQSQGMSDYFARQGRERVLRELDEIAGRISVADASTAQHEEAVRLLGETLGLTATRPDNDAGGKGPDVLWRTPQDDLLFVIELKTDKSMDTVYNKDDVGQIHNHIQWASDCFPGAEQIRLIIGPRLPCSAASSPPEDTWIVTPDEIDRLRKAVGELYLRAASEQFPMFVSATIAGCIQERQLGWESIVDNLERVPFGRSIERR